jgi:ABC-type Fe3+ transport system substrate-binding protein
VDYLLAGWNGDVEATAFLKNAAHPNTVNLFPRSATSDEGQKVYAIGGGLPAHPKVEPVERTQPAKVYSVGEDDMKITPSTKTCGMKYEAHGS